MAFDFPSSPSEGQLYTPPGGPVYVYHAPAWELVTVAGVSIGDAPPANPLVGQEWFESDTGNTFVWYNDGNTSQWVQTNGAGLLATTSTARNRIINGAMQISQENGVTQSASAATGLFYVADQWIAVWSTTGAVITAKRDPASSTPSPNRSAVIYFNVTTPGTLPAAGHAIFIQHIEGVRIADLAWGTASAKQIVVRFWFRAPVGTYTFSIRNGATENRSYLAPFTITTANVFQEITLVVPGDTTGTWTTDTASGIELGVSVAGGSNLVGVAGWQAGNKTVVSAQFNGVGATGVYVLADVGLYLDANNSGVAPRWEMPDEAQELIACYRYYFSTGTSGLALTWSGNVSTGLNYSTSAQFPVTMRTSPAMLGINYNAAGFPAAAGTFTSSIFDTGEYRMANTTGSAAFFQSMFRANARM